MHQPLGFTDSAHLDYVCLLQKSLYGLKQAPKLGFSDFPAMLFEPVSITTKPTCLFSSFTKGQTQLTYYYMWIISFLQLLLLRSCNDPVDTEKKLGPEGSLLCLYMHDPREPYLNAMKRVLRYLRGTTDLGLQLFRSTTSQLIAYSDADWAGYPVTRRSTSRYCVFLGDNLLTWSSKRQDTLSRSSAEAEYRGVANVVAETSWIRNLLL
ncbi:ribonuclease H-like domain-containing protein [Tanacetum coccineum]